MTQQIDPIDRIIIETGDSSSEYSYLLKDFEERIIEILELYEIYPHAVSIRHLIDREDDTSAPAATAMRALTMIKMLKSWERESAEMGPQALAMFHHIACASMNIGMWTTVISPLVSDLEKIRDELNAQRRKGAEVRADPFRQRKEALELALRTCWERGDRHKKLTSWSEAVTHLLPEFRPSKNESFDNINRTLSALGHALYGEEWPIRGRKRS